MKKQMFLFVPVFVLVGLILWLSPPKNIGSQSPCDDPEYLALKEEIARADPEEREALLREKGALLRFLEKEKSECLKLLSEYTPMSERQRATSIALHGTQIAQEARYTQPTPLVAPGYEGPYPTIPVPTVHSDEFLPAPISWRLGWQGHLTIIQVGWLGPFKQGLNQGALLIWKPELKGANSVETVPLTPEAQGISRLDIVTVCKPFVVIAGRMEGDAEARYIWEYDLSERAVHLLSRSEVPCWDPSYQRRDPTKLGK